MANQVRSELLLPVSRCLLRCALRETERRVVRDAAVCHPKSPQLDSTQSGDLFLVGEVAMMANWFGFAARSGREGSPLAGEEW